MKWKMAQYHRNNIRLISLYRDNLTNLDWVFRAKFRKVVGVELPKIKPGSGGSRFCTRCGTQVGSPDRFCSKCGSRIATIQV